MSEHEPEPEAEAGTATLRGLEFGCDTAYPWVSAYPPRLIGTADVREHDVVLPRRDGVTPGHNHLGARTVVFELQIRGTNEGDAQSKAKTLAQAFAPGPGPEEELQVTLDGTNVYSYFGGPRGVSIVPDRAFVGNYLMHARAVFVATDSRVYDADEGIQEVGLDEHVLPQTLPFILGYHDSEPIAVNGTAETDRWTVTFGPATGLVNPSITHIEQGAIVFHDLTMASGDSLVVDGRERRATLNGDTVIVPTIAQWFRLTPGAQTVRFAAGIDSDLDATATVEWRSVAF